MTQNSLNNSDEFRNLIDYYLSKWKFILLIFIASITIAYIYLRYSTYEYKATTTIKIKDNKKSNKLSEISTLQNYGLFSSDYGNVDDEIQILKSRTLVDQVARELNLNIKYFVKGRIKDREVYVNPPLNLNFFKSDSVISLIDTTFFVKIISETHFEISGFDTKEIINFNDSEGISKHAFGDKLTTSFSDLIILPKTPFHRTQIGSVVKIQMTPIRKVVENYVNKISIQTNVNSNILSISLNESVREKAQLILNELIKKYNNDAIFDKEEVIKVTSDFINNRLAIVSQELEQVDLTAENLKKNNRLSDLGSQSSIFLQSEKENEAQLIAVTNQIQLIDYMQEHLSKNNNESDLLPTNIGISDNGIDQLTKNHNDLVLQRNRILKNSTNINPTVINLNNQIRSLKGNINQSIQNVKASNVITLSNLNKKEAVINSQIFSTPRKERQFRDITRQQSIKESLFLYLLQKREEIAITLGMSSPNSKVIDTAFSSYLPIKPKKTIVYLSAIILGLIIPIGLIYIKELLDTKIHNRADLAKMVLAPFIGDIPQSINNKKNNLLDKSSFTPKGEAFRMLRTNIDFMLQGTSVKNGKTIFVTSTTSQEGKSHTCVNLALSLSFSNKKVLLVETDIRVPKLNKYLNIVNDSGVGLTNYIADHKVNFADVINKVGDNLDIISSGPIPPNPAELLMSDKLGILFNAVKNKYDYIIVDTAAVGLVTDTLLISKFADMVIYVVRANYIDKRQLHIAQSMYDEKRLPNMVVLLNGVIQEKGYGYGYGDNPKKKRKFFFRS